MASSSGPRRKLATYRRKRDFTRTREPSGDRTPSGDGALRFVIQKHAASHLHFDLRLELDGVMKSWAVPKGPNLDPKVKRLAMEVEDHPIEYNTFEGTIPKGEYGGGTVMLWDRGTYTADEAGSGSDQDAMRRGYAKGKLAFTLHGERLHGSWALVRTRSGTREKPQWLLIKHADDFAAPGSDIVADELTSVATGRTMEEIAEGRDVWHSNRNAKGGGAGREAQDEKLRDQRSEIRDQNGGASARPAPRATRHGPSRPASRVTHPGSPRPGSLLPMLASVGSEIPTDGDWTFEPKYDGIRVLAFATAGAAKLITRNGKDKAAQFPEIVQALRRLASQSRRSLVLDGEIVALSAGDPARFQELQARMHVKDADAIAEHAEETPSALIVFDLLVEGDDVLIHEPWSVRRGRLEKRLRNRTSPQLRLGESVPGDGEEMLARARAGGWEGIIAKRMDAPYQPGARSKSWLKLKVEYRQEFVVGGYTEPRNSRQYIGALLLGYFDGDRFIYVGHTGGGFTRAGLERMLQRLRPLERKTSPFEESPKTNERAHWVRPEVVVEVKFNEWTIDGKLRQPIYLGTRDDKDPHDVGREGDSVQDRASQLRPPGSAAARGKPRGSTIAARRVVRARPSGAAAAATAKVGSRARSASRARRPSSGGARTSAATSGSTSILSQLDAIERGGGNGTLRLGAGATLDVSNIGKVFFPATGHTKGDLMRHYARVASLLLPTIDGRPLVLKRQPNGIAGKTFFQQTPPEHTPQGVRVATIEDESGKEQQRLIGGDLATLLYTIQLGCISVDPWHSRVSSLDSADYTILDLDPGPRAPFSRVVQVAGWVKEELDALGLHAALKTSGASGLHIVLPLPPATSYEAAVVLAQLIATRVAEAHPREATVERAVKARKPAAVYVDYLQNVKGKSVAGVYCVRARPGATVSTPLHWDELAPGLDPRAFTIDTIGSRLAAVGDIWRSEIKRQNSPSVLRKAANL